MKPLAIILSAAAIVAWVPGTQASADALGTHLGPRELAMGGAARADAPGAQSIALNPAGLALTRELAFEGAFGHQIGDEARVFTASGCDSTVPIPGCFYYRYLRATPELATGERRVRVHEGGANLARAVGPRLVVGVGIKYFDTKCEGGCDASAEDEDGSGFALDVGAIVQPLPILRLAAVGYNVAGASGPMHPRAIGTGATLRPLPALALSFDAAWALDGQPEQSASRYGGGAEYFLSTSDKQTGFPIRLGAFYDAGQEHTHLTAGVGIMASKLAFDLGASKQLGGDALMLQASLRVFGPRQVAGSALYR